MIPEKDGISAVLIVYHEQQIIERCLKSLAGIVDEIIVIHDGECHDDTISVVQQYTNKIFIEPHRGEAEFHQSRALEETTFSWVLRLDADEFLSEELRCSLRTLIKDERYDAYAFIWPLWNGSTYISKGLPYKEALYRKAKICAANFPHRNIGTHGVLKKIPLVLEHQPAYNNFTWDAFRNKWRKWIKVQASWTLNYQNISFYNYNPEQINDFNKYMQKQIHYAIPILAPAWFMLSFCKFFFRLKMWQSIHLFNVAFFQGLYAALLCCEIWAERNRKAVLN